VVPPERRYDQLLHAVVAAIQRRGYTPVARRSTETTSYVLLHRAAGKGAGQRRSYLLVVHRPRERCLQVRLYSGAAALSTGPPERQIRYYYQASRRDDLPRIVRELLAIIPPV
jgi:hypothetical protein